MPIAIIHQITYPSSQQVGQHNYGVLCPQISIRQSETNHARYFVHIMETGERHEQKKKVPEGRRLMKKKGPLLEWISRTSSFFFSRGLNQDEAANRWHSGLRFVAQLNERGLRWFEQPIQSGQ